MVFAASKRPTMGLLVGGLFPDDPQFSGTEEQFGVAPLAIDSEGGLLLHMQAVAGITAPGATYNESQEVLGPISGVVVSRGGSGDAYTLLTPMVLTLTSSGQLITVDAASSTIGSASPTTGTLVAGSDGTDLRALSVSSVGVLNVSDILLDAAIKTAGAAKATTGVQVGGNDGTYFRAFLTDATGQLKVVDTAAEASLATIATDIAQFEFDGSGNLKVNVETGGGGGGGDSQPIGTTDLTDVVPMGGVVETDSGNLEPLLLDETGYLLVDIGAAAAVVSTQDQYVNALVWNEGQPLYNTITADGIQGFGQDALVVLGYDGSIARQLLTDKTGRQVVVVDSLPELDIDFPDPSNYIDQDVNSAVVTPRRPSPPNVLQVNVQPTPLVLPPSSASVANLTRPPWNTPAFGSLPAGAFYNANVSPNNSAPFSLPMVASAAGQCVVVSVYNLGVPWTNTCALRIRNRSNGVTTGWQITPLLAGNNTGTLASSPALLYFNLPVASGDGLLIDVFSAATALAGFAVTAMLAPLPIPVNLRGDGRSLPLGTLSFFLQSGASSATLAAPPTGFRFLVRDASVMPGLSSVAANPSLSYTLATATAYFGVPASPAASVGPTVSSAPLEGWLCDPVTAIVLSSQSGTLTVSPLAWGSYDIVPA